MKGLYICERKLHFCVLNNSQDNKHLSVLEERNDDTVINENGPSQKAYAMHKSHA